MRMCRGALRCELAERYGQDLSVLLARPAGAVKVILEYVEGLPQHNRITEALHNDPEYAAMVVQMRRAAKDAELATALATGQDLPDQEAPSDPVFGSWAPPLAEYGLINQQLHDQRALLVQLIDTTRAVNGQKPSGIARFPGPRTLVDILTEQNRHEDYQAGIAVFAPHAVA